MSGSVLVFLDATRKHSVKITPSTSLSFVLLQACEKFSLNPENYGLSLQNKPLDLSLSIRFAGINSGQKLQLMPRISSVVRDEKEKEKEIQSSIIDEKEIKGSLANETEVKTALVDETEMKEEIEVIGKIDESKESIMQDESEKKSESQVKVYLPSNRELHYSDISFPESFYELTSQEIAELAEKEKLKKLESTTLKTRSMREREEETKKKQYSTATIRFRFQDKTILEGTFQSSNTTQDLENFVKTHIADPNQNFFLFTTPPPTKLIKNQTLQEQQLIPSALVLVSGNCKIKSNLLSIAKEIPMNLPSASEFKKKRNSIS